jgi:superfamily II DNA or RNA helicase/antitoxin component of MazEF toxin-antitoxin module
MREWNLVGGKAVTFNDAAWTPDAGLVREVEAQFAKTLASYRAHPALVIEHANHEESIRTGGYAKRTLPELTQNAADALAGAGSDSLNAVNGHVEIVLDETTGTLYCANSGLPFSAKGIESITMAHLSGKRGDEIGRFGLGFKSVLAVSDSPQVFSRSISFEFGTRAARDDLAEVNPAAKRYPILRTATVVNAPAAFAEDPVLADLASWATTIVRLPGIKDFQQIRQDIENFDSEFLLFVTAVREVRLAVLGADPFHTSHVSRSLGNGVFRIEAPGGAGAEWLVADRMHRPSNEARREVGEAVSRSEVKVTVAVPRRYADMRTGRFWSYFPLQDTTSTSALFNAPWSVNDDRTTLLPNTYNREILRTLSEAFVDLLPRLSTDDDPAEHLDHMPARGRASEVQGFGDEQVITHVRRIASDRGVIPDVDGTLRHASEVLPLDFEVVSDLKRAAEMQQGWALSPNTGSDAPHWSCYTTSTRITRLRTLYAASALAGKLDISRSEEDAALRHMPKRGLLSWLREWAEGDDPQSAANAFRAVLGNRGVSGIEHAKVIPTTDGMRSPADRHVVFLHQEEGVEIDRAVFVDPMFLTEHGIEKQLRELGFRDLDPEAILNARLAGLSVTASDDDLTNVWDAALNVAVPVAVKAMRDHAVGIRVPTVDGGWAWPRQVLDIELAFGDDFGSRRLDRRRCVPDVAHQLGVVRSVVKKFAVEDEPLLEDYRDWVLSTVNAARGPGDRLIEHIDLTPGEGPGPFSVLFMLRDADAPEKSRAAWTIALLAAGDQQWICEDTDTGRTYPIVSPARWAVAQSGIVQTNRGFREPAETVAPSLLRFESLLPLFRGPREVAEALGLPDDLAAIPPRVLRTALEAPLFLPAIKDDALVEFVVAATRLGCGGSPAMTIPAKVGKAIEPRAPRDVFVAVDDEEENYLSTRRRPYLRTTEAGAKELLDIVGCRSFADSFDFTMTIDGLQNRQPILDAFPGLHNTVAAGRVGGSTVTRALVLQKRVTTPEGNEDQPLDFHLEGSDLVVRGDADDQMMLRLVGEAFGLGFDNAQIDKILKAGLDLQREQQRLEARAATTDADRLAVYFGDHDLKEALPPGLWSALEVQGLVSKETSVAELFLTVYGADAVQSLRQRFRSEGFSDVPDKWAGLPAAVSWVRKMGFGQEFAGQRIQSRPDEFVVPGAVRLPELHDYQKKISAELRDVLTRPMPNGHAQKAMVELPTGAGKTRVAAQTSLRLFVDDELSGTILWIAQSSELCEQAVQTFQEIWRYLGDVRPLTIGRLWQGNRVNEPETEHAVVVATDAKLEEVLDQPEYDWLRKATAVFIDEAHRAGGSKRYKRLLRSLGIDGYNWERPLVGLSATPFKGRVEANNEQTKELAARFGTKRLAAFETDAYRQLVGRGVLASVKHEVLPGIDVSLDRDEREALNSNGFIDPRVYERIGGSGARMKVLVDHIMGVHGENPEWPILVFTPSVLSAQVLAASLRYRDVDAASISGTTGRQQRRDVIRKFKSGEIKVLANCDLLVQGFDAPGVRALYIARPTFSPSAYIQMAGRGLRGPKNGGKEECLIVDVEDTWGASNDIMLGYHEYEELWKEQRG